MRPALIAAVLFGNAAVAFAAAEAPPSNTTVNYIHPENFSDASDRSFAGAASPRVLAELTSIFQDLVKKYLAADEQLVIDVTDVDLAGYFVPAPRGGDWIRVMRESDWPRMSLRYTLRRDTAVESQGEARLSDMNYLQNSTMRGTSGGESLFYERRMLDGWFNKTFANKAGPPAAGQ
jgi:hypothetical protein